MQLHKKARKLLEREVQDKLVAGKKKKRTIYIDMRPFCEERKKNKNIYTYVTVFT